MIETAIQDVCLKLTNGKRHYTKFSILPTLWLKSIISMGNNQCHLFAILDLRFEENILHVSEYHAE